MSRHQHEDPKIILDWVNITYREILLGLVFLVLAGGSGLALWYGYFRRPDPQQVAGAEIRAAERALGQAASVVPPEREDLTEALSRASDGLARARELYRRLQYEQAIGEAHASQRVSDEIYQAVAGKTVPVAILTNIGGSVEIQRANSLRWQPATNGTQLYGRDKVRTLSNSGATLRWSQGAMATLEENMLINLPEVGINPATGTPEVPVELEKGRLTMEAQEAGSTLAIRTPEVEAIAPQGGKIQGERDPEASQTEIRAPGNPVVLRTPGGTETTIQGFSGVRVGTQGIQGRFEWIRPPSLVRPPYGKIFLTDDLSQESVELAWDHVPNADHYRLEISRRPVFTGNLQSTQDLQVTSVTVESPSYGTWWWRVYAFSVDGHISLPSEDRPFHIRSRDSVTGEGPALNPTRPPLTLGAKVLIEGTTDPGTLLTYSVNEAREVAMNVDSTGKFYEFVQLTRVGTNVITLRAQSPTGAETVKKIEVPYTN